MSFRAKIEVSCVGTMNEKREVEEVRVLGVTIVSADGKCGPEVVEAIKRALRMGTLDVRTA